ncbi:MAG: tRNA guanosine(34) transglycosylase Tgt [Candidatus Harrisonbacteria bacterium CG10_big_fil_rev_8_21_14_0_10_40_38]|uniref:tRNA guanosine(34) transglycosylase Tgt n=1 Tax=Candidatus Harrisonbacteria bacterium CG10_big_fil_rev_8_21_14_0_10_40_38 TaxID=1974583 RepID=A0A2H0URU8_9BACT|nr:MAG: tRNA guanosine(34) transglycosylase Tgt [Candidatus Harrisonbacteria bacterium CG10_big_fil_rev_8_21_14_0_10_40_38]
MFSFEVQKKSKKSKARVGTLKTPHGVIKTPAFIPVATLGVIKGALDSDDLKSAGVQCQITNTFHFIDLDATARVGKQGGLHKFFNIEHPIFTDSGGFQVFSLGKGTAFGIGKVGSIFPGEKSDLKQRSQGLVKIFEEGVRFRSPRDGREIMLTPESSAKAQMQLGADFAYLLDICGAVVDDKNASLRDLERTNRWYERYLKVHKSKKQKTFGIVQGGLFKDLRQKSVESLNELPVFGIAIGGALGKSQREMFKIISFVNEKIDWGRPHHLLGIGDLKSIPEIIKLGIDLFDCALPTRVARHGTAFTSRGYIDVKRGVYKNAFRPISAACACPTCRVYALAHVHFLFKAKEPLGGRLLTIHNLWFLEKYVEGIRRKIALGKF